jgi:hypothetical protein
MVCKQFDLLSTDGNRLARWRERIEQPAGLVLRALNARVAEAEVGQNALDLLAHVRGTGRLIHARAYPCQRGIPPFDGHYLLSR